MTNKLDEKELEAVAGGLWAIETQKYIKKNIEEIKRQISEKNLNSNTVFSILTESGYSSDICELDKMKSMLEAVGFDLSKFID